MKFNYKRILIVGCGGAGKSTLAIKLGEKLNLNVVHLDMLNWLPGWVTRSRKEFDILLDNELKKNSWIIDGNYSRTFKKRLKYADFCIFLDYPVELCLNSIQERVEKYKGKSRPDMPNGCPEQADSEFIEWVNNYSKNTRPILLKLLKKSKVKYIMFDSREKTEEWLQQLK